MGPNPGGLTKCSALLAAPFTLYNLFKLVYRFLLYFNFNASSLAWAKLPVFSRFDISMDKLASWSGVEPKLLSLSYSLFLAAPPAYRYEKS